MMKTIKSKIKLLVLLAMGCQGGILLAAEDVVAFYSFNGGAAGETAVGVPLVNAEGSSYVGLGAKSGTGKDSDLVFDDDVPGAYLSGSHHYKATAYGNIKSLKFDGTSANGVKVAFTDLATAISGGKSFTVEFFFKIRPEDKDVFGWGNFLNFKCGMSGTGADGTKREDTSVALTWVSAATLYNSAGDQNNMRSYISKDVADGQWHHFAFVYNASTKKVLAVLDYDTNGDQKGTNIVTAEKPDSPLNLNSNFRGKICGLRVTAQALTKDHFLFATDDPDVVPRTAFHLSLDGEPGETATELDARRGASGTAVETTAPAALPLVYATTVPNNDRYTRVTDGTDETYGTNFTSVSIRPIPAEHWPQQSGFMVSGLSYPRCDGGDFTLEAFVKCDWMSMTNVFAQCSGTLYQRVTIFGQKNQGSNYDFALSADLANDRYAVSWYDEKNVAGQDNLYVMTEMRDGLWHHFALVYDDTDKTLRLDIDYGKRTRTVRLENALRPRQTQDKRDMMFGTGLNNGTFYGFMDEVRYTHAKLEPTDYLKFGKFPSGLVLLFK